MRSLLEAVTKDRISMVCGSAPLNLMKASDALGLQQGPNSFGDEGPEEEMSGAKTVLRH